MNSCSAAILGKLDCRAVLLSPCGSVVHHVAKMFFLWLQFVYLIDRFVEGVHINLKWWSCSKNHISLYIVTKLIT